LGRSTNLLAASNGFWSLFRIQLNNEETVAYVTKTINKFVHHSTTNHCGSKGWHGKPSVQPP
jgi:hypothetical protein